MKCARELFGLLTAAVGVLAATAGTAQAGGVGGVLPTNPTSTLSGVTSMLPADTTAVTGARPAGQSAAAAAPRRTLPVTSHRPEGVV